jgi:glutathionylspermidine synthase
MDRLEITPRQNWSAQIEALGFDFYNLDGIPYWHESAYYKFSAAEIDMIEEAANTMHGMFLAAADRIVNEKLFPLMGIDPAVGKLIAESWERKDAAVYGRFDFLYDGKGPPKLLEYNADTPSSLFEASIVQWNWREQVFPKSDQFNSIHESLVARWGNLLVGRWLDNGKGQNIADMIYVTTAEGGPAAKEDVCTVQYMGALATEAGFKMKYLPVQALGRSNNGTGPFLTDLDETPIRRLFKLYPWEWLFADAPDWVTGTMGNVEWIEPMWKMMLSNKGILPVLWEMFPEHENLLPAYRSPTAFNDGTRFVAKPMLGREGANITIREGDNVIAQTKGSYGSDTKLPGHGTMVYQKFFEGASFGTARPNLGVWMANDTACGMGIREDDTLIVGNRSRFVPHTFE